MDIVLDKAKRIKQRTWSGDTFIQPFHQIQVGLS